MLTNLFKPKRSAHVVNFLCTYSPYPAQHISWRDTFPLPDIPLPPSVDQVSYSAVGTVPGWRGRTFLSLLSSSGKLPGFALTSFRLPSLLWRLDMPPMAYDDLLDSLLVLTLDTSRRSGR